ncbi:Domain of unknown function DUF3815 [Phaffia rhodozyma]|uniref:Threonine/serine exporter-like N-terminal domain-containing protein n=1 Tax=Phaffia rhodozyma TaxID=264483 RepID=A0A0F7SUY0_PHARH|nr:Domain of unknown function DUF3815 [Phaffia rhodozyma]
MSSSVLSDRSTKKPKLRPLFLSHTSDALTMSAVGTPHISIPILSPSLNDASSLEVLSLALEKIASLESNISKPLSILSREQLDTSPGMNDLKNGQFFSLRNRVDNYIDVFETDGVPSCVSGVPSGGKLTSRKSHLEVQAETLVEAHSSGFLDLYSPRTIPSSLILKGPDQTSTLNPYTELKSSLGHQIKAGIIAYRDNDNTIDGLPTYPRPAVNHRSGFPTSLSYVPSNPGVLSLLLSLQNQPLSGDSTPSIGSPCSSGSREEGARRERFLMEHRMKAMWLKSPGEDRRRTKRAKTVKSMKVERPYHVELNERGRTMSRSSSLTSSKNSMRSRRSRILDEKKEIVMRAAKQTWGKTLSFGSDLIDTVGSSDVEHVSRNAAGVLGSLVTTSTHLAAPASPKSVEIAPDASQPGYRLARTSFDEAYSSSDSIFNKSYQTTSSKATPDRERLVWEDRIWQREQKRREKARQKKKKREIFITQHVADILSRQEFILKLARALMLFGSASHRLEAQIQATARVLDIECQTFHLPGTIVVSFLDSTTRTSETRFLKQDHGLDLGNLTLTHKIYWQVVHDKMGPQEASALIDSLMTSEPIYKLWHQLLIGGLCSAIVQPIGFYGSLIDCLAAFPLGVLLVLVQMSISKNDIYMSLFEIIMACINSFIAAAISSSGVVCFPSVIAGSIVFILPGYFVLCGSLELANRRITSGAVRLVFSVLYAIFLSFGLAVGMEFYIRLTGLAVRGSSDYQCTALRTNAPWWRASISPWFYFLLVPSYLVCACVRNKQPLFQWDTIYMVVVACSGFAASYFSGKTFINRPDITSAIGSFTCGIIGGILSKTMKHSAFVLMVVGVLFQLPSGLTNGGLLAYVRDSTAGTSAKYYTDAFEAAGQIIQIAVGMTVGLFSSTALIGLLGGGRRRGTDSFSF